MPRCCYVQHSRLDLSNRKVRKIMANIKYFLLFYDKINLSLHHIFKRLFYLSYCSENAERDWYFAKKHYFCRRNEKECRVCNQEMFMILR